MPTTASTCTDRRSTACCWDRNLTLVAWRPQDGDPVRRKQVGAGVGRITPTALSADAWASVRRIAAGGYSPYGGRLAGGPAHHSRSGISSVTRRPSARLSKSSRHWQRCTIAWTMARPSPLPPLLPWRQKRRVRCGRSVSAMPGPWSRTWKRAQPRGFHRQLHPGAGGGVAQGVVQQVAQRGDGQHRGDFQRRLGQTVGQLQLEHSHVAVAGVVHCYRAASSALHCRRRRTTGCLPPAPAATAGPASGADGRRLPRRGPGACSAAAPRSCARPAGGS